jgi:hypothetical protein
LHELNRATDPTHEQRLAWEILRDSPSMRLLGAMPKAYWQRPVGEHFEKFRPLRLAGRFSLEALNGDPVYFRARAEEERGAAAAAMGHEARQAHRELADLYGLLAGTIAHRRSSNDVSVERREALLDDALDDTFPASDPPAIIAPGRRAFAS